MYYCHLDYKQKTVNKSLGLVPPAGPLLLIRLDSVHAHIFFSIVMLATRHLKLNVCILGDIYQILQYGGLGQP